MIHTLLLPEGNTLVFCNNLQLISQLFNCNWYNHVLRTPVKLITEDFLKTRMKSDNEILVS
jgi:hypothetical protein